MEMMWQLVILLGVHWLADFVLQSRWMAINKSSNNKALSMHVMVYGFVLSAGSTILFWSHPLIVIYVFVCFNAALHWCTDYVTSRITSRLWKENRIHDFFVVVGLDQLIHQCTLAITMWLMF